MKKKKLWSLGVMLILVLSTILAACGGGSDGKDTGSKDTSTGGDSANGSEKH